MSWAPEVEEIRQRRARAALLGGAERVARQHSGGKLTVRERVDALVDPGSFVELGVLAGEPNADGFVPAGYVMGMGRIDGREVALGGEDFTVRGGSERDGKSKSDLMEELARAYRIPMLMLIDGAGGNIENVTRRGYMAIPNTSSWMKQIDLMGEVPVLALLLGTVAGGPAGRAMLAHWSCMVKGTSELFAAGPPVVKRAIGADVTKQELGGSNVHVRVSGAVDNEAEDELDCFRQARALLSYLPSSAWELPPYRQPADVPDRREEELLSIIPRNRQRPYDMRKLVRMVVDDGEMFEIQPSFGACVITAFARVNGHVVGVVANNPLSQGGGLDGPGADKQCHFLELCDQFNIPVVFFVDVPGFMIGPGAERTATIRRGMRAFWMLHRISVPTMQIIVRRCYGLAGAATGTGAHLNLRLAWPSGEWGGIPVEGGVEASFRRMIDTAPDPEAKRIEIEELMKRLRSPFPTAEALGVEDIIDPRETRPLLIRFLEASLPRVTHGLGPKSREGVRP